MQLSEAFTGVSILIAGVTAVGGWIFQSRHATRQRQAQWQFEKRAPHLDDVRILLRHIQRTKGVKIDDQLFNELFDRVRDGAEVYGTIKEIECLERFTDSINKNDIVGANKCYEELRELAVNGTRQLLGLEKISQGMLFGRR